MPTYTFNGYADNTDLASVPGWTRTTGNSLDIKVMSNGLVTLNGPASDAIYTVSGESADHSFEVLLAAVANSDNNFPACVRVTDANNFIGARFFSPSLQLYKKVAGTFTLLSSTTLSGAVNDRLKVTASGNTISVYVNDVLKIGPITETFNNTATLAGICARSNTSTGYIDEAVVTNLSSAAGLSITSVTPSSFDSGITGIVIAGSGFGASQGSSTLTIGGQAQTVTAWSDTSITFTSVRGSVSPGNATLTLTKG